MHILIPSVMTLGDSRTSILIVFHIFFRKTDGGVFMNGIPIPDIIENPDIHSTVSKLMRKDSSLCEPDINLSLAHGMPGTRALVR